MIQMLSSTTTDTHQIKHTYQYRKLPFYLNAIQELLRLVLPVRLLVRPTLAFDVLLCGKGHYSGDGGGNPSLSLFHLFLTSLPI